MYKINYIIVTTYQSYTYFMIHALIALNCTVFAKYKNNSQIQAPMWCYF